MKEVLDRNLIPKPAIIYKITNLLNNKKYIGQFSNSCRTFDGYWGSGKIITKSIKKHGKENFKKEIIIEGVFNQNLLDELEIHYIQLYNTRKPFGYNITKGGRGAVREARKIYQFDLNGNLINEWRNANTAAKYLNVKAGSILCCVLGTPHTLNNFIFLCDKEQISKRVVAVKNRINSSDYMKNRYNNLEWLTLMEKIRQDKIKPVIQCSLSGEIINMFNSITEAAKSNNIFRSSVIGNCINFKGHSHQGFLWSGSIEEIPKHVERLETKGITEGKKKCGKNHIPIQLYQNDELIQTFSSMRQCQKFFGGGRSVFYVLENKQSAEYKGYILKKQIQ